MTPADEIRNELLVLRWRRGDRAALDEIFAHWNPRLLFYVRRLVGDEQQALDVLQQAWVQVVRRLAAVREPRRLGAWLYAVARNAAAAHLRNGRPTDGEERLSDVPADDPRLPLEDVEAVHHALARLPPDQREVLTLYFMQDLTVQEIAGVVGVPPGTVKSRLHYAKHAMRRLLADGDSGGEV